MNLQFSHDLVPFHALRTCLREPIPEIAEAANLLELAVDAHLCGNFNLAAELIQRANIQAIREWNESIWGKKTRYNAVLFPADKLSHTVSDRVQMRMPTAMQKVALLKRDGYHCRFCGIPVVRREIRDRLRAFYPEALTWGSSNRDQHAAFQAMWVQFDHVLPHAQGGDNSLENLVVTCGPCNFGRSSNSLAEMGLFDPRAREPFRSGWSGLEIMCHHVDNGAQ